MVSDASILKALKALTFPLDKSSVTLTQCSTLTRSMGEVSRRRTQGRV